MYREALALALLFGVVFSQLSQSPTIDCSNLFLLGNRETSSLTISSDPVPHDIVCVRRTSSVDVKVIAADSADITDVMVQVYITGSPSGIFLASENEERYAVGCTGRALFSTDRVAKDRMEGLWFNSNGFDLNTKNPTCMVTLVDTTNRAWEAVAVPAITSDEYERQRLAELIGATNNMFAESAQPPSAQRPTTAAASTTTTVAPTTTTVAPTTTTVAQTTTTIAQTTTAARVAAAAQPSAMHEAADKILDISLSSFRIDQSNQLSQNRHAIPFGGHNRNTGHTQTDPAPTPSPEAVARLNSVRTAMMTDFMNPFGNHSGQALDTSTPAIAQSDLHQPTAAASRSNPTTPGNITTTAPATTTTTTRPPTTTTTTTRTTTPSTTTTTTTTTTPTTTTTTPTTTTTTPTTTTTTTTTTAPTTTTTAPTTTTTSPTTTTTTTTPTTTTTTPTTTTTTPTTTTTTPTTTTRSTPSTRRPTRPITSRPVTTRRPAAPTTTTPTTTTPTTTTTPRTTTTTQPVNLDMGSITVEDRTYEHHCLNGNLKRVLIPHTSCRHYMTLMNGLPGAFSKCPSTRRDGQQCFDVVTCSCIRCHPAVCPPSFDPVRQFNVTIYNSQRDPIGRIAGEFIPNRGGGYNENIQINGLTDPGYLPLRNPDGSIQSTTAPPPERRAPAPSNNRRGPTRSRGGNRGNSRGPNRGGANVQARQSGINGVISNLLNFF